MNTARLLLAAGVATLLCGCALMLGIDDVTVKEDGGGSQGNETGTSNDGTVVEGDVAVIDDVNVPFVDSAIFADGPVTDCDKCANGGVLTECALTCDEPSPLGLAVDDTEQFAYFTDTGVDAGGAVFQVLLSGGVNPALVQDAGNLRPGDIAFSSAHKLVFYGLNAGNTIARYDGGPNGVSVWEPLTAPTTLRSASGGNGGRIFVLSGTSLTECDVDTCSGTPPVFTGGKILDFSIQDSMNRIGWGEDSTSTFYYGDLNGSTSIIVASGQTGLHRVAINGGDPTTYAWSVDVSAGNAQVRTNGTGVATSTTIFNGQSIGGIQFASDGTLYFTDTLAGIVYARSPAGTLTIFADQQDAPGEIVTSADWVLWVARGITTRASGRIMRKHR